MLAQNNEYLQETVSGVAQLSAEEQIRQRCQAREDYLCRERRRIIKMESLEQQVTAQQSTIDEQQAALATYADKEFQRISKKIKAGKSLKQIADELEEDVENIRPLYNKLTTTQA